MILIILKFGKVDTVLQVSNAIFLLLLRYFSMTRILINIILGCIAFFMLLLVAFVIFVFLH